jgi:hypothetical protein
MRLHSFNSAISPSALLNMLMNQILEYRVITILVPFPQKLTLIAKAHVPFESFGIFFQPCPESDLDKPWIWKFPLGDE